MKVLPFGGKKEVSSIYIILLYDIIADKKGATITRRMFTIAKKYLTHIQKSVFEGNITELNYQKLKMELSTHIRKEKDSLIIFKSRDEKWLDKEFWGKKDDKTSNYF